MPKQIGTNLQKGTFNTLHVPVSSMQGQPFASLAQVSICRHLLVVLPCHTRIFSVGIDDLRYGDPTGIGHGFLFFVLPA